MKLARHHTHDRVRLIIKPNGFTKDRLVGAEFPLP
jgi:hypothetical protein